MRVISKATVAGGILTLLNWVSSGYAATITNIQQPVDKSIYVETSVTTKAPNNDDFLYGDVFNQVTLKLIKIKSLEPIYIEIEVSKSGGITEYRFQHQLINDTGINLAGYRYELGFGTKDSFINSNLKDGLDFDSPNLQQQELSGELGDTFGNSPISFTRSYQQRNFKRDTLDYTSNSLTSLTDKIQVSDTTNIYYFVDVPDGLPNRRFTLKITPIQFNEVDSQLPQSFANAVLQDMSGRTLIPVSKLRILKSKKAAWSNGCMGVVHPERFCTMSIVEGWQVIVTGKQHRWFYNVSDRGHIVLDRRASIPSSLVKAALQQTARRSKLPISDLTVFWVEQKVWSDGCLNIASTGKMCSQSMVPGWQITIASGNRRWIYNTDLSSRVKFNTETVEKVVHIGNPVEEEKPIAVKK